MSDVAQRLLTAWEAERLPRAVAVPTARLIEWQRLNRVSLPPDVLSYFQLSDGMVPGHPGDCDSRGFSFWPLEDIQPVPRLLAKVGDYGEKYEAAETWYVFCDYLQWSWAYAINLDLEGDRYGSVALVGGIDLVPVAATFADFVELYLADAPDLYRTKLPQS